MHFYISNFFTHFFFNIFYIFTNRFYSDSEDYLEDEKYTSVQSGSGGVEAAARARSESLLRSVKFSKRNRIIAPKSSDLINIEQTDQTFAKSELFGVGREDGGGGNGVVRNDGEGGAEI